MSTNPENQVEPLYIELCDANEQPLMQLQVAEELVSTLDLQDEPQLDPQNIARLNSLLSLAPASATTFATHSQQLLTCSFDYSRLIQASDGSGAIGGVFKEGTRQIGAQARFHEATQLQSVVNTGLLLNVASQVLAQKHLADINERLKSIEDQVKGLREFLEDARRSRIQAFQEHLQRIGDMLSQGEDIIPDSLQVLLNKEKDVRADAIHIRQALEKAQQQVRDFDSSSWFGSNDIRQALLDKVKSVRNLQSEYMLSMQCLLLANLILFIKHGGNKEFVRAGNDYLVELKAPNGLLAQWEAIKRQVQVHLNKMKPVFELARSTQANAQIIQTGVEKINQQLEYDTAQVEQLQQRLIQAQNPRLLLQVEGGQVVSGRYLAQ